MSHIFRELLKKVGSGNHTGENLTRAEASSATTMMLKEIATPAQIGAFMISHRIKRPTSEELAGMLDAYKQLGPILNNNLPVTVLGNPYDGRSRTMPVTPITALMLAAANKPVVMHGGDCMPTKYGLPLIEIWQQLGVDFSGMSLVETEKLLDNTGIGFVYIPKHFPLANNLVTYRDQIGKRPPFATIELIWSPCANDVHICAGYVHPPTEELFCGVFALNKVTNFSTIKGLEGSCDLPLSRTAIIGLSNDSGFERLLLHPRDYNFETKDIPLESKTEYFEQLQLVLQGVSCELMPAAIWNGGFYLWRMGVCEEITQGFELAEAMLKSKQVAEQLQLVINFAEQLKKD